MLRVRVEIVPYGVDHLAQEIACLEIGNITDEDDPRPHHYGLYKVDLVSKDGDEIVDSEEIGTFRLHRFGWQRNRLGLAARALKMLQLRWNKGKYRPSLPEFMVCEPYEKDKNIAG